MPPVIRTGKDPSLAMIRSLMAQSEETIDLEKVEVAVEHLIDPRINEADTIKKLDALAANIRARYPQGEATDTEVKGMILLTSLRDVGPWNDWRGFRYDFNDPFGTGIDDKLLSHFLETRLGNCVSMPVLFVVLGQKLALPVTLSMAPKHEFAKFRKDNGEWTNVEVTSYGGQTDQHYVEKLDITPLALANKIWLQTLTRKQSALLLFQPLAEYYYQTRQPERELALTELLLKYEPKNVSLIVLRGDAYAQLSDKRYKRYGSPNKIPRAMLADYQRLEHENQLMFDQAESMGWEPETVEHRTKYMQSIQQAKTRQRGG